MTFNEDQFLISTIVNGNEVKLYRRLTWNKGSRYSYYMHWGLPRDNGQSIQELTTPKGRDVSLGGAIKEFLAAAKAAQYLTFSKL
jgi:hypothetical protein